MLQVTTDRQICHYKRHCRVLPPFLKIFYSSIDSINYIRRQITCKVSQEGGQSSWQFIEIFYCSRIGYNIWFKTDLKASMSILQCYFFHPLNKCLKAFSLNWCLENSHVKLGGFSGVGKTVYFVNAFNKKTFQLKANRPFANRCMGYIIPSQLGDSSPILHGDPYHHMDLFKLVHLGTPSTPSVNRQTWPKTLPSLKLRVREVKY